MARSIGAILRNARKRREIDLSEVETATRIRLKYLRAIEREEWGTLPGGVYTRGFIRAYASFLGLDGDRLAEDYRERVEGSQGPQGAGADPVPPPPAHPAGRSLRSSRLRAGWVAVAGVVLVAVLAIVAIPGGGGGRNPPPPAGEAKATAGEKRAAQPAPPGNFVSVRLATSAEVWVCMLGETGRHLVDGQILEAGAEEGPFHSGSFTVSFGNGGVSMLIDGKEADIPPTSSPIGYSIDASGELTQLSEAERPTCT